MNKLNTIKIGNETYRLEPFVIEPSVSERELYADLEYDLERYTELSEEDLDEIYADDRLRMTLKEIRKDCKCEIDKEFARIMKGYEAEIINRLLDKKEEILNKARRVYEALCASLTPQDFAEAA